MTPVKKKPKKCPDCLFARKEYGQYRCTKHYDFAEDNARAIRQTGVGITSQEKRL